MLYSAGSIKCDVRQTSRDTGSIVGMYRCLMTRRMLHIVCHRGESGAAIEDDVLSHGVHCSTNLYSQYETGFAGFAAPRAVR
jgi:hypothetical protein